MIAYVSQNYQQFSGCLVSLRFSKNRYNAYIIFFQSWKIQNYQKWKLPKMEITKNGNYQKWKLPKMEITKNIKY